MRLAIVTHQGSLAAGAEHALVQFLERLPATIEPIFFFFEDGDFAQAMRRRFGSATIVAMSARVAGAKRSALPLAAVADGMQLVQRLRAALRRAAPDLVLTNSMKAHVIGSLAAKSIGVPCVNYVHDIVSGPARTLLAAISRICAAERLTCSKAVAAMLDLPRTTTVYAPIDVAQFAVLPSRRAARIALGLPDDGLPVVALVGRIARWKGQDRFVRIARAVLHTTDAHFAIVGSPLFGCDAEFLPELQAEIAAAGLEHRVHFIPWQSDMCAVYAAIDLSCNCSVNEPFGRTSLEALAAGIPIVCFNDAGICEILQQQRCGVAVRAGDEIAFAGAVAAYLEDPQLMAQAKADARIVAQPLDIANVYGNFVDVIQRVGNDRSARRSARQTDHRRAAPGSLPH